MEKVFVLDLGPDLPPCVGVIDLVLRKGDTFVVVDHKSGRDFRRLDPMQLAIYREHVVREHGAAKCKAYIDSYRWVNNLRRIRKPAFQRYAVRLQPRSFHRALVRFSLGYAKILDIEESRDARGTGSCWACPYRGVCRKTSAPYP